jgi:hypothetical protein
MGLTALVIRESRVTREARHSKVVAEPLNESPLWETIVFFSTRSHCRNKRTCMKLLIRYLLLTVYTWNVFLKNASLIAISHQAPIHKKRHQTKKYKNPCLKCLLITPEKLILACRSYHMPVWRLDRQVNCQYANIIFPKNLDELSRGRQGTFGCLMTVKNVPNFMFLSCRAQWRTCTSPWWTPPEILLTKTSHQAVTLTIGMQIDVYVAASLTSFALCRSLVPTLLLSGGKELLLSISI